MKNAIEQLTRILEEKEIPENEVSFVAITPSHHRPLVSVTFRNVENIKRFEDVKMSTLFDTNYEAYFDYYEVWQDNFVFGAREKNEKATAATVTHN